MAASEITTPKRVPADLLKKLCIETAMKSGMNEADAKITAEVLVTTDLWGVHSHGTVSLRRYLKRMREGGLNAQGKPKIVAEGASWAVVDGDDSMGMVAAYRGTEIAIEKARTSGVGFVTIRNSSHFGAAGYYANMAIEQNMIGLSVSGCTPIMNIPGAKGAVMGNNPLAFGAPAGKEKPFLFDIALSKVAAGKIVAAHTVGKTIPDDWYIDGEGQPTTDPSLYPKIGAMLPMAGHKGYGFAVMVEVLASVLSGGVFLNDVRHWLFDEATVKEQLSQSMIVINIEQIMPVEAFKARMDELLGRLKSSPKAKGVDRIYVPGEMEWERYEDYRANGIPLPKDVAIKVKGLADDHGIETGDLFA